MVSFPEKNCCLKKTKKQQKKPKPSLLPTKNTIQENRQQNINDAQIWPRVVLPISKAWHELSLEEVNVHL